MHRSPTPLVTVLRNFLLLQLLLATLAAYTPPAHADGHSEYSNLPLGVNGGWDWVDLIKGLTGWNTVGATAVTQDAAGWPTSDAGMDYDIRRNMPWRAPDAPAINEDIAGIYKLSFTGQATIVPSTEAASGGLLVQNQIYNAQSNQTTADLVLQPGHSLLQLQFLNTQRLPTDTPGTGFTNMHLLRPGYSQNTQAVFTPGTLAAYEPPFAAIRFLNVDSGNGYQTFFGTSLVTTRWEDRVQVADAYQAGLPARNTDGKQSQGVAWEYMIMLANATHHDMWINIPDSADDDYVMQLANLIRNGNQYTQGLERDLHVYVEYSNEVWNFSFPEYTYNQIIASQEGITVDQRYIERTIQIGQIFEQVFGESSCTGRVRPVALWQYTTELTFFNSLGWAEQKFGFPVKTVLYGIGEAPYYDAADTSSVDATFATMWTGSDAVRRDFIGWQAVAAYYGLKEVGYESGPGSLLGGVGAHSIRDRRMIASIVHHYLDNWFAVGGDTVNYYALQGDVSEFGDFMLVEDYEHLRTPTYLGALGVLSAPRPPLTAGNVLPFMAGQTVNIDPSQRTPDIFVSEAIPGSGLTIQPNSPNVYLLRASGPGTFALRLYGHAAVTGAAVNVFIDDQSIGTLSLNSSDGVSSALSFSTSRGFHSLSLATSASSAGNTILPAGTGAILIQQIMGGGYPTAPSAPSNLTAVPGSATVSLSWASATTATTYSILRSTQSGGPYTLLATTGTNRYVDTSVSDNNTYYYVVNASNAFGTGAVSSQVSSFPAASAPPPPGGLNATFGGGDAEPFFGGGIAILTWNSVPDAMGYNVYRSPDGSSYTLLTTSPQSATRYTDLSINNGSTYYYVVTSVNYLGESSQSSSVSGTPVETVRTPPVLHARNRDGFIFLRWKPDPLTTPQFGTAFNVKRSTSPAGPFVTIIQTNTYNAYDYTAIPGCAYFYEVTATNGLGESAPSNSVFSQASKPGMLGYEGGSSDVPHF
ncbi:fibronectin type III domain-containing protein [Silvibacterium acidisoli]|uniref:fibronectin type III domain-containing protein n=1 Tax=Acidobacteriaceae bacterium ZG23-2 TaxID=2883246 RepID=UPI00406CA463